MTSTLKVMVLVGLMGAVADAAGIEAAAQYEEMLPFKARQRTASNQSDIITRAAAAIKLVDYENSTGGFWKSTAQHQAELVRKLYDELSSRVAEDISIMIFNHANDNQHDLRDVDAWRTLKIGQFEYDVWLFKCGILLNTKPARGFDNWIYGGQCWYTTQAGNKVHFQHSDCPNYELRQMRFCGQHTTSSPLL